MTLPIDKIELMYYYFHVSPKRLVFPLITITCGMLVIFFLLFGQPKVVLASNQRISENDDESISSSSYSMLYLNDYPKKVSQWQKLILRFSMENNVDPKLIAAVILQESGGDPNAYSTSGAVGLMQIMPHNGIASTFICGDHLCFKNRPSMDELFDPEFNLQYGVRFLAALINNHQGNIRDALKAYGPMDAGYYYADKVLSIYKNF